MWTSGKATAKRIKQGQIVHNGDLSLSGSVMQLPGLCIFSIDQKTGYTLAFWIYQNYWYMHNVSFNAINLLSDCLAL